MAIRPEDLGTRYQVGAVVRAVSCSYESKRTEPPARFTESTLLDEMTAAHKYARSEDERAILREIRGLGTARTRDATIRGLTDRGFLELKRQGRGKSVLVPTELARTVCQNLPALLLSVAITATWEFAFKRIETKGSNMDVLIPAIHKKMMDMLSSVVDTASKGGHIDVGQAGRKVSNPYAKGGRAGS